MAVYERLFPALPPEARAPADRQRQRGGAACVVARDRGLRGVDRDDDGTRRPVRVQAGARWPPHPPSPRAGRGGHRAPRPREGGCGALRAQPLRPHRRCSAHREPPRREARRLREHVRLGRPGGPARRAARPDPAERRRGPRRGHRDLLRREPARQGAPRPRPAAGRGPRRAARPRSPVALPHGRRVRHPAPRGRHHGLPQRQRRPHRRGARGRARGRAPRLPRGARPHRELRRPPRERALPVPDCADPPRRVLRAARARATSCRDSTSKAS